MKKFFACMVALMVMSTTFVYADQHSAMLEQGDSIALFYGADALQQAYAVADSGAVITLSKGKFAGLTIEKSLTLVGYYGFSNDPSRATVISGDLVVSANKTSINGVYVTEHLRLYNVSDCTIRHSWLISLNAVATGGMIHTNTIVDQCVVSTHVSIPVCAWSKDFVIKNSTIRMDQAEINNPNPIYLVNNVIYLINNNGYASKDYTLPYGIFTNNIFVYTNDYDYSVNADGRIETLSQKYANTYLNNAWARCRVSDRNYNNNRNYGTLASVIDDVTIPQDSIFAEFHYQSLQFPAYPINPGLGSDGTPRGPLGGTGFTDRPSIPRITGRDIDLNPDAGGKLNVKITVSAE
ncbi:MAG: hypothetical protein IJZ31_08860 [Bacteroidaceae bacterium]|nr:hypothetical protein [Bacteroidaceae bacterium]